MKNYKQILEAINRGIKFALDDFDDNEQIQGQTNNKVSHQHGTKEYLDLIRNTVDFNLPSGNLWYKYNLNVNPNQLSTFEDWYGDYYAWGELEPKDDYNIYNYKYSEIIHSPRPNIPYDELYTKYCHNPENGYKGYSDNLTQLEPGDDAVHVKLGLNYFIPTESDFRELFNNTVQSLRKDYKGVKGLNGIELTNKENDQRIFLPFAGYKSPKGILDNGIDANGITLYLWTSSFKGEKTNMATNIIAAKHEFEAGWGKCYIDYKARIFGLPIRPVYKK